MVSDKANALMAVDDVSCHVTKTSQEGCNMSSDKELKSLTIWEQVQSTESVSETVAALTSCPRCVEFHPRPTEPCPGPTHQALERTVQSDHISQTNWAFGVKRTRG